MSAYPAGSSVPNVSSINVEPGVTRANQVTVPVGANGQVSLYNAFGSLDLLVDVLGYYDVTGTAGGLIQVEPTRIYDSRSVGRIESYGVRAAGPHLRRPGHRPPHHLAGGQHHGHQRRQPAATSASGTVWTSPVTRPR